MPLLLIVLLLWAVPAQAVVLLELGWEESHDTIRNTICDFGSYNGFPDALGTAQYQPFFLDTSTVFHGSQSLRANFVGHQNDGVVGHSGGFSDCWFNKSNHSVGSADIWFTWYTKMETGFKTGGEIGSVQTKHMYFFAYSPSTGITHGWTLAYHYADLAPMMAAQGIKDAVPSHGTDNMYQNMTVIRQPKNKWVCYEVHIRMNTPGQANGEYQQYFTNMTDSGPTIQTTQESNRQFVDPTSPLPPGVSSLYWFPADSKWSMIRMYRQDGIGQMWYDRIRASTTRLGCGGGGGTPPDTTPPGPTGSLTAPATSPTSSQLTWTVASDSGGSLIASTVLLRCTGAACTPTQSLTTVSAPTATYLDSSLAANTTYGYRARGRDGAGNLGPLTSTVYVTTPSAGSGAITFDAVSNSITTNTAAALPVFSHTTGVGANRLLIVATQSRGLHASVPVVSVTYGGAALTFVRGDTRVIDGTTSLRTELWQRIAPASGAGNVAVTFTGTLSAYGVATALSVAGADQTTPAEASAGSTGTGVTLSATVTSITSDAWIVDSAIGRGDGPAGFVTVGSGQVVRTNRLTATGSVDAVGVSTVNGKTPAGNETMDWTQGSAQDWALTAMAIKPFSSGGATPAPVIDSLTRTATTLTVTYGTGSPTLPTYIRLAEGNNAGTSSRSVVYARTAPPFDSATATTAILTLALLPGADYSCVYAQAAGNVENQNPNDVKCVNVSGLVPIDTAAPILSNLRANGNVTAPQLPNGATVFTFSLNVNKTVPCLWDTVTHATYDLFPGANAMTTSSLTASVAIASGVPAYPATQGYFAMCQFTDLVDATHDSAVSSITVSAAAPAGDTTAPSAVTGVVATALSQSQVGVAWDANAGGDGVTGYTPVCSFGAGNVTYVPCGNETLLTTTILNLPANTVINVGVLANDAAGNVSLISNISTITTTTLPDLDDPTSMSSLAAYWFKGSVFLVWPQGFDFQGPVTTQIEQCLQVSAPTECTDFALKQDQIALSVVSLDLAPSTSYCFRGRFVDGAGRMSPNWSPVVCGMTKATGILMPRTPVPFGVDRPAAGTRGPRP